MDINYHNFCVNRLFTGKNLTKKFIFPAKEPSNGDHQNEETFIMRWILRISLDIFWLFRKNGPQ